MARRVLEHRYARGIGVKRAAEEVATRNKRSANQSREPPANRNVSSRFLVSFFRAGTFNLRFKRADNPSAVYRPLVGNVPKTRFALRERAVAALNGFSSFSFFFF